MGNCFEGVKKKPVTPPQGFKVCIAGGAGSIGANLSLLVAMDPLVKELSVYDLTIAMVPAEGVATDLAHLERRCAVKAYSLDTSQKPIEHLKECLSGCSLVLSSAGIPRKSGQDRAEWIKINAGIAKSIAEACAKYCPNAILGILVNPLNSVVPAMARLYEKRGLDPLKIVGVTTLDCVRANKFVHEVTKVPIENIDIPVVGGNHGKSVLPLFSQDRAAKGLPAETLEKLDARVQEAEREVMAGKKGKASSTLSLAYAGARFSHAVLAGLAGTKTTECAYVKSSACEGVEFFSSLATFGVKGIEKIAPVPLKKLSPHEQKRLAEAVEILKEDIKHGLNYANSTEMQM